VKGRNKIVLCPSEMREAVQHYFEKVLFRGASCPHVESVQETRGAGESSFEIVVTEAKG
jgi:hypothetical protein